MKRQTWVIKIGSARVTNDGRGLDIAQIDDWSRQIGALAAFGHRVVVVSSGAVAQGMVELGWDERPIALEKLQAAAAIGQLGVAQAWRKALGMYSMKTAQVLLTNEDLANNERSGNIRSTLSSLLDLGVVPVINENDTVATEEITLGDNDRLGALTANLITADKLVILTDQKGLMDDDPRENPKAKLIRRADVYDPKLDGLAGEGMGALGRGGMRTKLLAARQAAKSGTTTIIADGRAHNVITRLARGDSAGTVLRPSVKAAVEAGADAGTMKTWL